MDRLISRKMGERVEKFLRTNFGNDKYEDFIRRTVEYGDRHGLPRPNPYKTVEFDDLIKMYSTEIVSDARYFYFFWSEFLFTLEGLN